MSGVVQKYFPDLDADRCAKFENFQQLFRDWNSRINLVSRKDIGHFEINHLLHSLAIAKFINFKPGSKVLDLGCGGGLPGLPLAIYFPQVQFHLIDRIGKKINAAASMVRNLGLQNVALQQCDSGECHDYYDFVVSRAVMPQADVIKAVKKNVSDRHHNDITNGIITLKGGDLIEELSKVREHVILKNISEYFDEEFFKEKKIVYTPCK